MRNLHLHTEREFGKKSVILLQYWEHLVKKMAELVAIEGSQSSACQQALLQLVLF